MDEIDLFKDKWQKIENEVISRAHMTDSRGFVKALELLVDEDATLAHRVGLIDDLRALRNVFVHRDRTKYIAVLESHVMQDLDEIYELVVHPPTVIEKFGCEVYSAAPDDLIVSVMDTMTRMVYTHVPILKDGRIIGVFAYNSFFEWAHDVLNSHTDAKFEKKQIKDINRKYLLAPTVFYDCLKKDLPAGNVESTFRKKTTNNTRLDCLFITEDGSKSKPILGIITAWDMYKLR